MVVLGYFLLSKKTYTLEIYRPVAIKVRDLVPSFIFCPCNFLIVVADYMYSVVAEYILVAVVVYQPIFFEEKLENICTMSSPNICW